MKYVGERAAMAVFYANVIRPLREIWSGVDIISLSLLASRNISAAGFNYYLTTQDKNYSALHASLLMTFEGKAEVFGDFSDESNLVDNFGEKLQEILKNGTRMKLEESEELFNDPDKSGISSILTGTYTLLKWINNKLLIYLYPYLFNIAVPYNMYFIENTAKEETTFKTSKKIDAKDSLDNSIINYEKIERKLDKDTMDREKMKVLNNLERLLKSKQHEFETHKTKYDKYYKDFLVKKQKAYTSSEKIGKINEDINNFINILKQHEDNIKAAKGEVKKIRAFDFTTKANIQTFFNENDNFVFDLYVLRDLLSDAMKAEKKVADDSKAAAAATVAAAGDALLKAAAYRSQTELLRTLLVKLEISKSKEKIKIINEIESIAKTFGKAELENVAKAAETAQKLLEKIQPAINEVEKAKGVVEIRRGEKAKADKAAAAATVATAGDATGDATVVTEAAAKSAAAAATALEDAEADLATKQSALTTAIGDASKTEDDVKDDVKDAIIKLELEYLNFLIEKTNEKYKTTKGTTFENDNFLLVNTGKLEERPEINTDGLINLNLPLTCLTEAMALFPSNYDKKIHDDLVAYNQNKNKFMEAYRAKQKK